MAGVATTPVRVPEPRQPTRPRPVRQVARTGWLPALLVTAFTAGVLRFYDVPLRETAVFGAYIAAGVTLPGTLWWRALRGKTYRPGRTNRYFTEEVAAGTALGYAMEVLAYIPARAAGKPLLFLVWPAATIAAFAAVPALRRHWKGPGASGRVPLWWAWSVAAMATVLVAYIAVQFYRHAGLTWPGSATVFVDWPWQLSLAGEVKHHLPATYPYVMGEPLFYHWFAYADLAAGSWTTGIELQTLVYRLSPLPLLAATTVLIGFIAYRITGRWWAGAAAMVVTYLASSPAPWHWPLGFEPVLGGTLGSPTMTFGALVFAALVLLVCDVLHRPAGDPGRWVLIGVLAAVTAGAKSTLLPILLAGLLLVVTVHLLFGRRLHRGAAFAALLIAGAVAFAQIVLFHGAGQGLQWAPLHAFKLIMRGGSRDALLPFTPATPLAAGAGAIVIYLFCVGCACSGIFGLLRRPKMLIDPPIVLLAGMGVAGVAGLLLLGHPGRAEYWFIVSVRPYLAILAACGLAALVPRMTWRTGLGLPVAAALGAAVAVGAGRPAPPLPAWATGGGFPRLALGYLLPCLVMGAAAALTALVVLVVIVIRRPRPALSLGLPLAMMAGFGLPALIHHVAVGLVRPAMEVGWKDARRTPSIAPGGAAAGRWLRDHSGPDDVVATNAHCFRWLNNRCDNRHHWISAYTERRVLVEGWGYSSASLGRMPLYGESGLGAEPFADRERLAVNDAAFRAPSPRTIGRLRDRYGVRWLFVDNSDHRPAPTLGRHATLRYRAGCCAVYEVAPAQVSGPGV